MILYVDINDFIVDDVQKNLLAHAMIATGVVEITEKYLFRDISKYDIDDKVYYQNKYRNIESVF